MDMATFTQLAVYNTSNPSGCYEGKMWRRMVLLSETPRRYGWYLCWFAPSSVSPETHCQTNTAPIVIEKTNDKT